ncbi:MAG: hypothetical protein ABIP93_05965 [Gemmatimonadaceae bacterium]
MLRSRRASLLFVAIAITACRHGPANVGPVPQRRVANADELAIYRTLAESTYVRSTGRPVAVLSMSLDSSCGAADCAPLATRWGLESPWWASVADSQRALATNAALLRRAADTVDLRAIGEGHEEIIAIAQRDVPPPASDARFWGEFQYYHKGAAGVLRFSPIGFSATGKEAIVFMDWECGPACGHTLVTALRADSTSTWRIADMLLLSSRQPSGMPRNE